MCYYLYGATDTRVNVEDHERYFKNSKYKFNIGTKDDVNKCVSESKNDYRITDEYCDCETALGDGKTSKKELKEYKELLLGLRNLRDIQCVYLSKNWDGEVNEDEKTVHIDEIDVVDFLANIKDNCLYKIELCKKYY
ncbi:MAG: hypothetical protein IJ370_03495 [Oscillospiraceae bacterium]|nr:hypothetical protein [Oscillospiraceae bacterium]MBQ8338784.1 hypothetical protein [Oscillospiraceae bacterium]